MNTALAPCPRSPRQGPRGWLTRIPTAALLVVVLLLVTGLAPARADNFGKVNCHQGVTSASCTAAAGSTGTGAKPAKGEARCRNADGVTVPCSLKGKGWYSSADGCYYKAASASQAPGPAAAGKRWFVGTCGDPVTGFDEDFAALAQFATAPGPETVAQQAIAMLRLPGPEIMVSPSPDAVQVVRVPSWLWIAAGSWKPRTATATAGGVSVTATARPTSAMWSTGDGSHVTCHGPGTAWHTAAGGASASPTCGHTYLTASPTDGYRMSSTITWEVTWAGAGQTGVADPLTSTATVPVRVVQSSAVNVSNSNGSNNGATR